MKPLPLNIALVGVLVGSLAVGGRAGPDGTSNGASSPAHRASSAAAGEPAALVGTPASLSAAEREALERACLADAGVGDLRAGFAMHDDDVKLVLGTVAVVVIIAILL